MKNYQPDYYNNFKCIADKCSITCCQEWKIAVDELQTANGRSFLLIKCLEKVTI